MSTLCSSSIIVLILACRNSVKHGADYGPSEQSPPGCSSLDVNGRRQQLLSYAMLSPPLIRRVSDALAGLLARRGRNLWLRDVQQGDCACSVRLGATGRGRGSPDQEALSLTQQIIEEKLHVGWLPADVCTPLTCAGQEREKLIPPEERRTKRREKVTPSEISPSVTQTDEAFLRTKAGAASRTRRTKPVEIPPNVRIGSSMKPRHMMDAEELELYRQRKELAKAVLSRNAPETQEGVVYLPGWNMDEGGNYVKPEEIALKESAEKVVGKMKFEFKPPLEVLDMLKTLNIFVREYMRAQSGQGEVGGEQEESMYQGRMTEEELEIVRIKMMRKHWIPWLKAVLDEEQAEVIDPAKQSRQVRLDFLADMDEAMSHGRGDLKIPTEEEAIEFEERSRLSKETRQSSRIERETRRVCDLTNKMSQDLSKTSRGDPVAVKARFDQLMAGYRVPQG
eukprot:767331-Hanusia_phi.AAC.2